MKRPGRIALAAGSRVAGTLAAGLLAAALLGAGDAGASEPGGRDARAVPTEPGAPWPSMRHDRKNTGRSPIRGRYHRGDRPWSFRTGKGVFSTPVVGADETVYVGSADTWFYALGRGGRLRWRYKTGEIIDSAAVLGRREPALGSSTVTFGSGDEHVYRLRTLPRRMSRRARTVWRFRATRKPATGQAVNWWEGNVTMGFGGTLFAGNTGGAEYAISPRGRQRWVFATGNAVWSNAAIGDDGSVYFTSLDLYAYALDPGGKLRWRALMAHFATSSPAIDADGTVYVASFNGSLYALDPKTGETRWTFATDEHVYASPALGPRGIYIASADGSVYALDRRGGLRWRYDTGDPIRSSPVLGRGPGGPGHLLYVGSADGTLYALDAESGRRRWSFDATPRDAVLRDRNDLNASPALGRRGVYIGGEHGLIVHVPYDWCLRHRDTRCDRSPGEVFDNDLERMAFVTPGGTTRLSGPSARLPAATALATRLVVRAGGETVDAGLAGPEPETSVTTSPQFRFRAQPSGDYHYLHVVPDGFLEPNRRYEIRIRADWAGDARSGRVADTIRFRTERVLRRGPPLRTGQGRVSAFTLRRLAVPLPPLLPSVNQIGFDSYDLVVGALDVSAPDRRGEGSLLLWAVSTKRDRDGLPVADRRGAFSFPLSGRYRHDSVLLSQSGLTLGFSFGDVPLRRFDLRMQLDRRLRALNGASLYAEVFCPEVPVYGPALVAIGICNRDARLPASGTFITRRYPARGLANRRPRGLRVAALELRRPTPQAEGSVVARLSLARGARFEADRHAAAVLLTDARSGAVIALDYRGALATRADPRGNLREVRLKIPRGTEVPPRVRAYVIADVFPLLVRVL
jgi:outer membrane protein assembly factor BamB